MSSEEQRPAKSAQPPQRPSLIKPPARPTTPPPAAATPAPPPAAAATPQAPARPHPISPPSEPRQYRAIGLVRGTYEPEVEQLNRGNLTTPDGLVISSVLLGRITSLIKNHVDLATPHLWVVYPRTRQDEQTGDLDLHLQIVGMWEPETLGLPGEVPPSDDASDPATPPETSAPEAKGKGQDQEQDLEENHLEDNYFSIRGEVIKYDEEEQSVIVKILQAPKQGDKEGKSFRLHLTGTLASLKTVGYFWDFEVERQGKVLIMKSGHLIGIIPPKKRKPMKGKRSAVQGHSGSAPASKGKPKPRPTAPVKSNPL